MSQTASVRTETSTPVDAAVAGRPTGLVVAALALAGITVAVMQTLTVPLVPQLPTLVHASSSDAAWVITITLLTGAIATPTLGRLGDMFGKRRMLLVALGLMIVGALICAVTSSLLIVLIGRALQGAAMGAIPLGISIMRDILPPEKLGSSMGLMSSSMGIGGALALPVAALVAQNADWHMLFFGAAALGAVSLTLVLVIVPESPLRAPGRFDLPGAIGLSAGLVFLLLGISKGGDWGWGSPITLGCLALAVVVLVGWGFMELRITQPLVDLRTTAKRQVLLTNLASIMVGFAFYAMQLVPTQLLQLPTATGYGLGLSMVVAGLAITPMGIMMMAASPLGARLTGARGPRTSLLAGLSLLAVTYLVGFFLMDAVWQLSLVAALAGVSIGLAYAAMPSLIIAAVPSSETGAANGLNTLMRSIGTASSAAVVGMVLAHMTTRLGPTAVPSMAGFRTAYLLAFAASAVAIVIAAFLPARRSRSRRIATRTAPAESVSVAATPILTDPAIEPVRPPVEERADIRGRVLEGHGRPVVGAVFTVIEGAGRQVARAASGPDGGYALITPEYGTFTLICAAGGYQPLAKTVFVDAHGLELDLTLVGTATVHGRVLLAGDRPFDQATVTLVDIAGNAVATYKTGSDGSYRFAGLSGGDYTVVAAGHAPTTNEVTLAADAWHQVDFDFQEK